MPEVKDALPVLLFPSLKAWEDWLAAQPSNSTGLWLKLAKKSAKGRTLSKDEAIEGALCHGWIDGQLKPFDADFWLIRFTPRKRGSKWSERNRVRAGALMDAGRVAPAGLREIETAKADGRWDAAYAPQSTATVPDDLAQALDATPAAKAMFATLDRVNRYAILYRVYQAASAKTRAARIEKFIGMLERGELIHPKKGKE